MRQACQKTPDDDMNAKHLSQTSLWYTPVWLIEKATEVLGGTIDFDPASDGFGESRVNATVYWEKDALERTWPRVDSVFINPPGGKIGGESSAALFWKRTVREWAVGKFRHAIFVGFSIEIMQTGQCLPMAPPQAFPFWVPRERFGFDSVKGPSKNPSHAPVVVYLPPSTDNDAAIARFANAFKDVGFVRT
jgi:hypothetical protein